MDPDRLHRGLCSNRLTSIYDWWYRNRSIRNIIASVHRTTPHAIYTSTWTSPACRGEWRSLSSIPQQCWWRCSVNITCLTDVNSLDADQLHPSIVCRWNDKTLVIIYKEITWNYFVKTYHSNGTANVWL